MPDEGPGFFADKHVIIFGLGLMGGSLALALKGKCRLLTGIDTDQAAMEKAVAQGVVNQVILSGQQIPDADLIILAAPVNTIIRLLSDLPAICANSPVVLDFGSTKQTICEAMQKLPGRFDPIGGHPMCGKESSGLSHADLCIFKGAAFALVPLERTSSTARQTAEALVKCIGSHPVWMSAENHDRQVAATSHLPYLVANALAYCTPASAASMAASGFTSTTRLAATSPSMMMDVLQTNRDAILNSLHQYREHLAEMENLLFTGNLPDLQTFLVAGAENRMRIERSHRGEIL